VIGKRPEIKTTSQLIEALRNTKLDRLKVIENATPKDVESYMRQCGRMTHDVIVISHAL
jgi:hypothetical protein